MVVYCCVTNCKETSNTKMLHIFPKSLLLRNRWCVAINRLDLLDMEDSKRKNYKVCDIHFTDDDKFVASPHKTNLKVNSVPSIHLGGTQLGSTVAGTVQILCRDDTVSPQPGPSTWENMELNILQTPTKRLGSSPIKQTLEKRLCVAGSSSTSPQQEVDFSDKELHTRSTRVVTPISKSKLLRTRLLKSVTVRKQVDLTPKAYKLYKIATDLKKVARRLDFENAQNKQRLTDAYEYMESSNFLQGKVNQSSLNFILSQLKMQKKNPRGRRFSLDDKIFALSLLKQGPRAYKILRRTFALPSKKIIMTLLSKIPFNVGINPNIMKMLEQSVKNLDPLDRCCSLMFDEISLEPSLYYDKKKDVVIGFQNVNENTELKFADHALVLMVKGIRKNWKQPISFYFIQGGVKAAELKHILYTTIECLQKIGLNVVATICDQYASNKNCIQQLVETTGQEGSQYSELKIFNIGGQEIVALYDTPHLLKGVRNNFINYDVKIVTNGVEKRGSWKDIVTLYEMDVGDFYTKMCFKLTDQHIYKDKLKKMKVKLAAQVFSHRVASTMRWTAKYARNKFGPTVEGTAEFIALMDQLFDSVNGSTIEADHGKLLKCAVKQASSHITFWVNILKVLRTMKFVTSKGETVPPTIKNWITTLRGLVHLWVKLQNIGFKFLCTRSLNQDPLENFFSCIRSYGIRNINPSSDAFINSFKGLLINNFTSLHSPGANCEPDINNALNSLKDFLTETVHTDNTSDQHSFSEGNVDICDINIPEIDDQPIIQSHAYIAGYIAKAVLKDVKSCRMCKNQLLAPSSSREHEFISELEYKPNVLLRTRTQFRRLFSQMVTLFKLSVEKYILSANFKRNLISIYKKNLYNPFLCNTHDIFNNYIDKFLTLMIFTYIKQVNQILKGKFKINKENPDRLKKMAYNRYIKLKAKNVKVKQMKNLV